MSGRRIEPSPSIYSEQTRRIREKFHAAHNADLDYKVFGATTHRYLMGGRSTEGNIAAFEARHRIELPECYKAFLLEVGDGGAGPHHGLYSLYFRRKDPLREWEIRGFLQRPCILDPRTIDEQWRQLQERNEHYPAGVLIIGSQGCSYCHGLILNGLYQGAVLNIDEVEGKAQFAFEANFLDWYERWLDEVISGELIEDDTSWFGFAMGGSEERLLEDFPTFRDAYLREGCLRGLLKKRNLNPESINIIELIYDECNDEEEALVTQILAKFDYSRAKPYLKELADKDLCRFFQSIDLYCKEYAIDWFELMQTRFSAIVDLETFKFGSYVLAHMKVDYGLLLIPFTLHEDPEIRCIAFHTLGKLSTDKKAYLDIFQNGLEDSDISVVHEVLMALEGVHDEKLIASYQKLAKKHPTNKDFIRSYLKTRQNEFGLDL